MSSSFVLETGHTVLISPNCRVCITFLTVLCLSIPYFHPAKKDQVSILTVSVTKIKLLSYPDSPPEQVIYCHSALAQPTSQLILYR